MMPLTVISHGPEGIDSVSGTVEEIGELRRLLDERDQALLRAAISVTELQLELDASKEEAEGLRSQLSPEMQASQAKSGEAKSGEAKSGESKPGVEDELRIIKVDARQAGAANSEPASEVERLKKEWQKTQRSLERVQAERKAEQAKLRSQIHEAQHLQLQENRARRMESAHASSKIANLEKAVESATARAVAAETTVAQGARPNVRLAAAAATAAALLAGFIVWASLAGGERSGDAAASQALEASGRNAAGAGSRQVTSETHRVAVVPDKRNPTVQSAGILPVVVTPLTTPSSLSPENRQGFQAALSRLNRVLLAFPNRKPEQILREVHEAYARNNQNICSFEWNHGQPAVLYSGERNNLTLSATLSSCAEALEKQLPK
jgi:hypothetical protein